MNQTLQTFADIEAALEPFIPRRTTMSEAYTLERITKLMTALGNPQEKYPIIHIAGTSGKTSTAYYMASLLRQSGKKVGLTVSPHIDHVNERVQINLVPMPEARLCRELERFLAVVAKTGIKPTYFEVLVAFAFWEFARQKVDYAVIEVGLGGLLDGTNVVKRPDKVCIITDIGLDHTQVLGKTVEAIAAQKAGIVHPHNEVFIYQQDENIMNVVREVCSQQQATLHEIQPRRSNALPTNLPLFQQRNWYLAFATYEALRVEETRGLPQLNEKQLARSVTTYIPARMETYESGDKVLIMDGAHNTQKLGALLKSVKHQYPTQTRALLFNVKSTKTKVLGETLQEVARFADHIILTEFHGEQDTYFQSVNPLQVAERLIDLGFDHVEIIQDPEAAYAALLKRPEQLYLITGSFYLLNRLRPVIMKAHDPSHRRR